MWFFYIFVMVNTPFLLVFGLGNVAFSATFVIQWILIIALFDLYYVLPLFPLMFISGIDYYVYNLIPVVLSILLLNEGLKRGFGIVPIKLAHFNRYFFTFTVLLGFSQWFMKDIWKVLIPFQLISSFRGSAFQIEPSFLAFPLFIYISYQLFLLEQTGNKRIAYETIFVSALAVIITSSISVFLTSLYSFISLRKISPRTMLLVLIIPAIIIGFSIWIFSPRIERITEYLSSIENLTDVIIYGSIAIGSWRNIPDVIVLTNIDKFIFPSSNVLGLRETISKLGARYGFGWLSATFNVFTSAIITLGLLPLISILVILFIIKLPILNNVVVNNIKFVLTIYAIIIITFFIPKGAVFSWFLVGSILHLNIKKTVS